MVRSTTGECAPHSIYPYVGIYWQGFEDALSLPYTGLSLVKVDLGTVVLPDRQESNEFSQNDYGPERP